MFLSMVLLKIYVKNTFSSEDVYISRTLCVPVFKYILIFTDRVGYRRQGHMGSVSRMNPVTFQSASGRVCIQLSAHRVDRQKPGLSPLTSNEPSLVL